MFNKIHKSNQIGLIKTGSRGEKCNTKNPKPAAKTIDTAIIRMPEAIPLH